MTVKKLKHFPSEPLARPQTPRCEADVVNQTDHEKTWRQGRYDSNGGPFQCVLPSVVEIDGKHYCRRHGGFLALDMLIDGRLISVDASSK